MRVVQFVIPGVGRRVGFVEADVVVDVTSSDSSLTSVYDVFEASQLSGTSFDETLSDAAGGGSSRLSYTELLSSEVGGDSPYLIAPFDHPDKHRLLVSGTGLTHTGSMKSRDQMHSDDETPTEVPATDSAKMFQMGIDGGKPAPGERGVSPEKGTASLFEVPAKFWNFRCSRLTVVKSPSLADAISSTGLARRAGSVSRLATSGPITKPSVSTTCTLRRRSYDHALLDPS